MRKLLILTFVGMGLLSYGQNSNKCLTDEYNEQKYAADPKLRADTEEMLEIIRQSTGSVKADVEELYVIPVVMHIIHNNGSGNISMEQIEDGINMLNEDYRRFNYDSVDTRDIFKPYAGRAGFEFRLATLDPQGNPTNGVVRVNNPGEAVDADDDVKFVSNWPTDEYLNFWVVNSIAGGGSGTILGYAEFPFGNLN